MMAANEDWLFEEEDKDDTQIDEYDLTSTPNDFNTSTIFNFIESGAVRLPGFQRYYVWDMKRASKLIESLLIGLPVPQVFLYEQDRNNFLVIDGQQRLMTIYYFVKRRFPRKDRRAVLKDVSGDLGRIPDEILHDDDYFEDFNLRLAESGTGRTNKFNKRNYSTLGEYKVQFDLRTIRNVVVKQVRPPGDESSIFEIFTRLNTGGINLTPQEIRLSLFHSTFYELLMKLNIDARWRRLISQPEPDLHMRDVEVLLRAIAIWKKGSDYKSSMVRFLNAYSRDAQRLTPSEIDEIRERVDWFLDSTSSVNPEVFLRGSRFSQPLFEAVFASAASLRDIGKEPSITTALVEAIKKDGEFDQYSTQRTTHTVNVIGRSKRATNLMMQQGD